MDNNQPKNSDPHTIQGRIITASHTAIGNIEKVMKMQATMRKEDYSPHDVGQMCADLTDMTNAIEKQVVDENISDINQLPALLEKYLKEKHDKIPPMDFESLKKKKTEDGIILEAWGSALGMPNQIMEVFRDSPLSERYNKLSEQRRTAS